MIVAILGAGPAGMSCANACLSFGLTPVVIERGAHPGGAQRGNFHPNLWLLGAPGESGQEMTRRLTAHFEGLGVAIRLGTEVASVTRAGDGLHIGLDGAQGGTSLSADALVLATGTRPRATPALLRLAASSPRVIIGPLSDAIRGQVREAAVLILGGGDNALDHALYLAERGNRVTVCTRGRFTARRPFLAACAARPEIELRPDCRPAGIEPRGEAIVATWPGASRAFDWLLVMYGYRPNTTVLERFAPELRPRLTASGHLEVDPWQRTSVPRIYGAGDITAPPQPSVPAAIAQGLAAARAIERDLDAGD